MFQKIAWQQGMFLAPQHFEQLERYCEHQIRHTLTTSTPYAWGLQHYQINYDLLAIGKFSLTNAYGLFADGTYFNFPQHDELPSPLALNDTDCGKIIFLGLPELSSIEHYQSRYQSVAATPSTETVSTEIYTQTHALQVQLCIADEKQASMSLIPLARLKELSPDNSATLDNDFWPTCLDAHAHSACSDLIYGIGELIKHRVKTLAERLASAQLNEDLLLLQLLNRYYAQITHQLTLDPLSPHIIYQSLYALSSECATYLKSQRCLIDPCHYQHSDLAACFLPLYTELKCMLTTLLERHAKSIPFQMREHGIWFAKIEPKELDENNEFILGVQHANKQDVIRQHFVTQTKLAPIEYISDLIKRALPGIGMTLMPVPPHQVPQQNQNTYFKIDHGHTYWQALRESSGLGLHASGNFDELSLELWIIKS